VMGTKISSQFIFMQICADDIPPAAVGNKDSRTARLPECRPTIPSLYYFTGLISALPAQFVSVNGLNFLNLIFPAACCGHHQMGFPKGASIPFGRLRG
jgi:hypothetical protein